MEQDRISVIVPVYKVEPYLRKCLDSILGQTYQNLEIILVDDGSPDSCGAICDEYAARDGRITVIHKENGGVASARNAGLEAASGDWIGWVDSDDWIEPDMFGYLLNGAKEHGADIAACGVRTVGDYARLEFRYDAETVFDREQAMEEFLRNRAITPSCWNKLARRELWEGIRFAKAKVGEDLLAVGQLMDRAHLVLCLPGIKYNYLTRTESATATGPMESRLDCWDAAMAQYKELGPRWPQLEGLLAGRSAAAALGVWANYLGEPKEVRRAVHPRLTEIADFCALHVQDALKYTEMGAAGRMVIRLTPHPRPWAFALAWIWNKLYRRRHGRPL